MLSSIVWIPTTVAIASVRVPVLPKTTVSTRASTSNARPLRMNIPARAASVKAARMVVGTAIPMPVPKSSWSGANAPEMLPVIAKRLPESNKVGTTSVSATSLALSPAWVSATGAAFRN